MKILNANFRKVIFCILSFFLFAFLSENSLCAEPKEREYWPTIGWKTSTPELQGMDSTKLSIAVEFIQSRLPNVYSLLVVKNGYLVYEKYFYIGSVSRSAEIRSVTKSITSTLIGIALEKGYINSVDQKLIEFFPEYYTDGLDPKKKEISLENLLTMSAGFQWNERGPISREWEWSPDRMKFTIQLPLENRPGKVFEYNTSASHLLSGILTKTTKISTLDFANQHLFKPLGISVNSWRQDLQDYYYGGYGLKLTARDLAKIGYLYLNNGYWSGRSIISEYWVKESTKQQIHAFNSPIYGAFGYGYQWWVKKVDGYNSFRALGRGGQFIVVVPELDLVIVVTSDPAPPHPPTWIHYSPLFDLVAGAVKSERPPKKPLKAVELPSAVKAFITNYNQVLSDKNMMKIANFFSDRYLHDGFTKQMVLKWLTRTLSYTSEAKIIITKFEPEGDEVKIEYLLKDKYFEAPFITGSMLIKENGQWKWYGNQIPK